MELVDNSACHDPAVNLALEEFLTRRRTGGDPLLLLYVNDPAVVIGRHQVPHAEMGFGEVRRRRVAVVRRISGGGTVYHGPGNLNFALIQGRGEDPFPSASRAVRPVLTALRNLGLPACANERHDILLGGMKITGTAQYRTQDRCLTHGTLLVAADLEVLQRVLTPDCQISALRGRRSLPSAVTNLVRHRPALGMDEVRWELIRAFTAVHGEAVRLAPAPSDWDAIRDAAIAKYRSWEWTVGRSPAFTIHRSGDFPWGRCEAEIRVERGIMTRIALALPVGAPAGMARWAACLEGERFHPRDVAQSAAGLDHDAPRQALVEWICPDWSGAW